MTSRITIIYYSKPWEILLITCFTTFFVEKNKMALNFTLNFTFTTPHSSTELFFFLLFHSTSINCLMFVMMSCLIRNHSIISKIYPMSDNHHLILKKVFIAPTFKTENNDHVYWLICLIYRFPKSVFKLGSSYGVEPPPVNKQDQDIYHHYVSVGHRGPIEPSKKEAQFYNKYLNKFY